MQPFALKKMRDSPFWFYTPQKSLGLGLLPFSAIQNLENCVVKCAQKIKNESSKFLFLAALYKLYLMCTVSFKSKSLWRICEFLQIGRNV